MENHEEFELTPKQKLWGNLTAGAVTILCGLFLLLCGTNVIPLRVSEILAFSLFTAVGMVFLITGILHKNSVSEWLSFAFLVPALVELLGIATKGTHANFYPLYIAIPAIASFFTMLLTKNFKPHLPPIVFFGGIAILFMLNSAFSVSWGIVVPLIVVFAGLCISAVAVKSYKEKEVDD